jgi:choline transport protein
MGSSYDSSVVVPKQASPTPHRHQDSLDYAENGDEYHSSIQGHTRADNRDMQRMGKVQELRRNYRPLSALAFTVILQGVWEVLLT